MQRNDQGLAQKTVCYEIGNLKYNVLIVTDKFGKVIKKEKNFNFPEGINSTDQARYEQCFKMFLMFTNLRFIFIFQKNYLISGTSGTEIFNPILKIK